MSQQQKSSSSPISPTNSNSGTLRMNGSRPPSRTQQRMSKRLDDVENVTITSKFNFVDLAGSERVSFLDIIYNIIMIIIYLICVFFCS